METERFYVQLLLKTTHAQQIALLSTATDSQVKALSEIAYNIPKLTDLGPHQKFLSYLGNQKHGIRYKKLFVKKHAARLMKALSEVKYKLLEI